MNICSPRIVHNTGRHDSRAWFYLWGDCSFLKPSACCHACCTHYRETSICWAHLNYQWDYGIVGASYIQTTQWASTVPEDKPAGCSGLDVDAPVLSIPSLYKVACPLYLVES